MRSAQSKEPIGSNLPGPNRRGSKRMPIEEPLGSVRPNFNLTRSVNRNRNKPIGYRANTAVTLHNRTFVIEPRVYPANSKCLLGCHGCTSPEINPEEHNYYLGKDSENTPRDSGSLGNAR